MLNFAKSHRSKILLFLILLLTAYLTIYKIWDVEYGNLYYTAAVKSMLTSWHNFFFVSFDPGGFISVDKPPLGLWLQCLFALIFGIHGWSLILPEALCTLGSVAVLYKIVKRSFGENCALLSALFMALTPMVIAVSRTNNLDAPLVLVCLLALWALSAAAEKGSLKLLILSTALIGVGFNIKMLQSFMFLPAIYLVYFFTADKKLGKRVAHLAVATVVLAAVSLSWCLIVDLTPASARPFVGSSTTNSALELAIGYNGILRALPISSELFASLGDTINAVPNEGGNAGILRLFNREMAGQASWLLPLGILGLIALFIQLLGQTNPERRNMLRQLLLWGGLFVPMYVYFSISSHIHRYYLITLAPCIASLAAIAVTQFFRDFSRDNSTGKNRWQNILLPLSVAVTAFVQLYILKKHYAMYSKMLIPLVLISCACALLLLIVIKLLKKDQIVLTRLAAALGVAGLIAAPACWAYSPIQYGINVVAPYAGPPAVAMPTDDGEVQIVTDKWEKLWFAGADLHGQLLPEELLDYMLEHNNGARYLLAVPNIMFAAPVLLHYDVSVMAIGGYIGSDKSISLEAFRELVYAGELQYFYLLETQNVEISDWVKANGALLDTTGFSDNPMVMFFPIYDLSGLAN